MRSDPKGHSYKTRRNVMKRKSLTAIMALLSSSTLLASCGPNDAGDELDEAGLYPKITAAVRMDIDNLQPTNGNSTPKNSFYYNLYESLFDLDSDGKFAPDLAKKLEFISPTQWRITLFSGIKDSNGNEITGEDIVSSTQWLIDSAENLNYELFDHCEVVEGQPLQVDYFWKSQPKSVSQVEFPLCRTFIFDKQYKGSDFGQKPVTTGAYMVKSYTKSNNVVLTYNDNYWAKSCTDPEVKDRLALHNGRVREIEYKIITNTATATAAMQSGSIDYFDYVKSNQVNLFKADKYTVGEEISDSYTWVGFNMSSKSHFTNNLKLRQAIAWALDSDVIASYIPGNYEAMKTYGTPYFDDYNAEWEKDETYLSKQDLTKAKSLLAESGFDTSKTIKIMAKSSDEDKNAGQIIENQLENGLGLNVEVIYKDSTLFQTDTSVETAWDIVIFSGMGGSSLVGSWQLALSGVNTNQSTGEKYTLTFNNDTTLFEKYSKADASYTTKEAKDAAIKECIDYVFDNAYVYPLSYARSNPVYLSAKIKSLYKREGVTTLACSTFKDQEENKDGSNRTTFEMPVWGIVDPTLVGTYTFDAPSMTATMTGTYTLILNADGSFKLTGDYSNLGEMNYIEGTWVLYDGVVVLNQIGEATVVKGGNDKFCANGWYDSDAKQVYVKINDGKCSAYIADDEEAELPGIVTYYTTKEGYSCFIYDNRVYVLILNEAKDDATNTETGKAVIVYEGTSEVVYRGNFSKVGPTITVSECSSDGGTFSEWFWEGDTDSKTCTWNIKGAGVVEPNVSELPGIVNHYVNDEGYMLWNWNNMVYLLTKTEATSEDNVETGKAVLVFEDSKNNAEVVYRGDFSKTGPNITVSNCTADGGNFEEFFWKGETGSKTCVWVISGAGVIGPNE